MRCELCELDFPSESKLNTHIDSKNHKFIVQFFEMQERERILQKRLVDERLEFKKKLEEAEKKLKSERKLAEENLTKNRLEALNKNKLLKSECDRIKKINFKMFSHLRDHDINVTKEDKHSILSSTEYKYSKSCKSTCESSLHISLRTALIEVSSNINSNTDCNLCNDFMKYKDEMTTLYKGDNFEDVISCYENEIIQN